MTPCPVTCPYHLKAEKWLKMGAVRQLRDLQDVWHVMRERAWKGCACQLFERIQQAVHVPPAQRQAATVKDHLQRLAAADKPDKPEKPKPPKPERPKPEKPDLEMPPNLRRAAREHGRVVVQEEPYIVHMKTPEPVLGPRDAERG